MNDIVSRPAPHMVSSILPWYSPGSSPVHAGSSLERDMPGLTARYVPENCCTSGMVADIFPLSPKRPEFHFMTSGAAGRPVSVTFPFTAPEAQPSEAIASTAKHVRYPPPIRNMPSLPGSRSSSAVMIDGSRAGGKAAPGLLCCGVPGMRVLVERLCKTYPDRSGHALVALDGIDLAVAPEEFVAILGPSGCGKSTLLGIIAGLSAATSGQVLFEGERRPGQPLTATVFQEFALFPWRTVQGNVEFGLEELGLPPAERRERSARFIAMTGLEGFEAKFPHQLSGGMRQRVGIARALAVDPAVLLMDEPFSALDAQTRTLMMEELLGIWERARTSILYVTHNIQEAVYMADRVVVLSRRPGRVLDTVPVALKRPRHEGQMGEADFLHASERIWGLIKSQAQAALVEGRG